MMLSKGVFAVVMMLAVGFALLGYCAHASAQDWDVRDVALEAGKDALIIADWSAARATSRAGIEAGDPWFCEPLHNLREAWTANTHDPRMHYGKINMCMAAELIATTALDLALPHRLRWIAQSVVIGYEANQVQHQARIGLRFRF